AVSGQLGGTARPFDPSRRVIAKPGRDGRAKVFIGTPLDSALFKDLTLKNATFANVSLAGARFDDIDFSNTVITSNCNFAGMQISPNASRLLIRLGLKPALDKVGVRPQAVHQRRWDDGRTLQRAPLGAQVEATFGAPYYHFHRGDLAELLGAAVPVERLHVG